MSDSTGNGRFKAVRQMRASEDVAAQILDVFYAERLQPGEWLGTEAELAERFNVSRVTIRDAVSALEARGLIDVRVGARGGLRIAKGDPHRLVDAFSIQLQLMGLTRGELFEAMTTIEPTAAFFAASRATEAELSALSELVERSRAAVANPEQFAALAVAFHQAVANYSGNRALHASLAALRATQLEHLGPPTTQPIAERVARVHGGILAAIVARDGEGARQRMLEHLAALTSAGHEQAAIAASV